MTLDPQLSFNLHCICRTNIEKFTILYHGPKLRNVYHLQLPLLALHLNSFQREFNNCLNFLSIQKTTTKLTNKTQINNPINNKSNFVMLFSSVGDDCSIV